MSYRSISLSLIGAFSYEWNNYINESDYCAFKFLRSSKAFFQSLFCGYSVNIAIVEEFYIKNSHCKNTIFIEEYSRKVEDRNVQMRQDNVYVNNQNKTHVARHERKIADNDVATDNSDGQAFLHTQINNPSEERKETNTNFVDMYRAIRDENFKDFDLYFATERINKLRRTDYLRLLSDSLAFNRSEIAARLIAETPDEFGCVLGEEGISLLCYFVMKGPLPGVILLVEKGEVSVNCRHKNNTPLIIAAKAGNIECLDWLLKKGADLNGIGEFDLTALHYAAVTGHLECLNRLLQEGATVNNNTGCMTPLYLSASTGQTECLNALIQAGADIN